MDAKELSVTAQEAAGSLSKLFEGVEAHKSTMSPKQRKEVEKLEKDHAIIQESAKQMKNFNFDLKV